MDRQVGLQPQALVETLQQSSAAGEHDAAVENVGGKFGGRALERELHGFDDLRDWLIERLADLDGRDLRRLGDAVDEVAPLHLDGDLFFQRHGRPDLALDGFRRPFADEDIVVPLKELDDGVVHLVARDAARLFIDDAAQSDDGDLRRSAADVHDHVPDGGVDVEVHADCGRHRLGEQMHFLGARMFGGITHGALFHLRDARRNGDDDPPRRHPADADLLDEFAQHPLGDLEVGDDAVPHWPDGPDVTMRSPEHLLRLVSDGDDALRVPVERDDRRLVEDDAFSPHPDDRVGGPQIDGEVGREKAKNAHAAAQGW